jgi:plasmid stabilization system protein ParE
VFVERVFAATERLSHFPRSGRIVPEMGVEEIREVIVQSYRVIYRVVLEEVEILTVHHGARPLR